MMIQITVQGGVVQDVETSEPAQVQIVDLDAQENSTFATVAQTVEFEPEGHEADALLNHEVMADPLHTLFNHEGGHTEPDAETKDAQSFDLMLELDDEETQAEVSADCGCRLERTEYTVGFIYCDQHRYALGLLRDAILYTHATYNTDEGDLEPRFVAAARSYGIE